MKVTEKKVLTREDIENAYNKLMAICKGKHKYRLNHFLGQACTECGLIK